MSAHLPLQPSTAPTSLLEGGVNHFTFFESDQPGLEGAVTHITVMEGEGEDQIKVKQEEGEEASKIPATLKFPYNAPQPLVALLHAVWRQDLDSINALKRSVSITANCMGITLAAVIMRHLAMTKASPTAIENMKQFLFSLGVNERECLNGLIWGGYFTPEYLRLQNISSNPSLDVYYALAGGHQALADKLISKLEKPLGPDHYARFALGAIAGGNLKKMLEYISMLGGPYSVNKAAIEQILGKIWIIDDSFVIIDIKDVMIQHASFFNHREILQAFSKSPDFRQQAVMGAVAAGRLDSIQAYEAESDRKSDRIGFGSIFRGQGYSEGAVNSCINFTVKHGQKDLVWPLIEIYYSSRDKGENTKKGRKETLRRLQTVVGAYPYMLDCLKEWERELMHTKKSDLKDHTSRYTSMSSKTHSSAAFSSSYSSSSSSCSPLGSPSSASSFLPAFSRRSSRTNSLTSALPMLNSSSYSHSSSSNSSHSSSGEGQHDKNISIAELAARVIQLEQTVEQQKEQLQKQNNQIQYLMSFLKRKSNVSNQPGESEVCVIDPFPSSEVCVIDPFPSSNAKGIKRKQR